jgi:hypothetical protein
VKGPVNRLLLWAPRILCILFAVFVSLFALDVFGEGYGFWETVLAPLMHLIPTIIVVFMLLIAWRWEWIGGILFIALGMLYIIVFWEPSRPFLTLSTSISRAAKSSSCCIRSRTSRARPWTLTESSGEIRATLTRPSRHRLAYVS